MPSRIRLAVLDDAPELLEMYAPAVRETPINFEFVPPTLPEYEERMSRIMETYPWIVKEEDGQIAGFTFAGPHRTRPGYQWSVETGIYVQPEFRRMRVGRSLYLTLIELLRIQGFHRAFAGITLPNEPSVALHLAAGFELIGVYKAAGFKLGRWHDAAWYQRQIGDRLPESPAPPLRPDQLVGTDAWGNAMSSGLAELQF